MVFSVIPFLLIVAAAMLVGVLTKLRFANVLPVTLFGVICLLYVSYIFDRLAWGRLLVLVALVALIIGIGVKLAREEFRKQVFKELQEPAVIVFLVASAFFFWFSCDKFVFLWDELRLWGAYPKALYVQQSLQLGEDALLYPIMQSYPPAMPLFGYFMESFCPSFSEPVLFWTYDIFGLSLLLPIFDVFHEKRKNLLIVLLALLAAVAFPWYLFSLNTDMARLYSTLFIDPTLGLCCGYYFYYCFKDMQYNRFSVIRLALAGICLTLLKDSGAFLAIWGLLGGLLCRFVAQKKSKKKLLVTAAIVGGAWAAAWGSWQWLLSQYTVTNHVGLSNQLSLIGRESLWRIVQKVFVSPVVVFDEIVFTVGVSLAGYLLLMCFIRLLTAGAASRANLRQEIVACLMENIGYGIFYAGYCLSFLPSVANNAYPSYERYMGTLLLSATYLLMATLCLQYASVWSNGLCAIKMSAKANASAGRAIKSLAAVSCLMIVVLLANAAAGMGELPAVKRRPDYERAEEMANLLAQSIQKKEETQDVYLCIPPEGDQYVDSALLHHRTYFLLLDDGIRIKNFYSETDISSTGLDYTPDEFLNVLRENKCEYVFFEHIDEALYDTFHEILVNSQPGDSSVLYQFDAQTGSLERIV